MVCPKSAHQFMAYSGPKLLGLVALWEHLGEDWNQQEPDILGELTDRINDQPGNEKQA